MKTRILIPVALIALVALVIILDGQRRQAQKELKSLSVKMEQLQGNSKENQERAREIVAKVKAHMEIDTSVEPTVATIIDVKKLQEKNAFYNKAKNGDFLIVTPTRAILYDAAKDVIIDVVPVQIEQPVATATTSSQAQASSR